MNVSKRYKQHTFQKMLARGWGRVVTLNGQEIVAIFPPNQPKATLKQSQKEE